MAQKILTARTAEAAAAWEKAKKAFLANDDARCEEYLWECLANDPDHADAWQVLGVVARRNGHPSSVAFFSRAADLKPDDAANWVNLGESLMVRDRLDDARCCQVKAINLDPKQGAAYANLAMLDERRRQYLSAERHLDTAIAIDQKQGIYRVNKVQLLMQSAQHARSLEAAEQAVKAFPDLPEAHWNYALTLIQHGRWAEGFREYEWRWKWPTFRAMNQMPNIPIWDGGDPKGKSILLVGEQGAGDVIQMVRYARAMQSAGAEVGILCDGRLVSLMRHVPGITMAVNTETAAKGADAAVPMFSLPCIFGSTPENVGAGDRYIDPPKSPKWADRISGLPGKKVGICYAGNPKHMNDADRSMKVADLSPLAGCKDATWVNLQFDRAERWPIPMFDYSADVHSFLDSAQMIDQLDMVITVDTAVAHLAGALGKPTLLVIPHSSDARWMIDTDQTPWYPTMRIRRKPCGVEWREFMEWLVPSL